MIFFLFVPFLFFSLLVCTFHIAFVFNLIVYSENGKEFWVLFILFGYVSSTEIVLMGKQIIVYPNLLGYNGLDDDNDDDGGGRTNYYLSKIFNSG